MRIAVLILFSSIFLACGGKMEWQENKYERFSGYFNEVSKDSIKNELFRWVPAYTIGEGKAIPDSVYNLLLNNPGNCDAHVALYRFTFNDQLEGFIIKDLCDVNRHGVNLYFFDVINGNFAIERSLAGYKQMDNKFSYKVGWITDINNDELIDILTREKTFLLNEKISLVKDTLIAEVWHQDRFLSHRMKNYQEMSKEFDFEISN